MRGVDQLLSELSKGKTIDLRADGKAGNGLVMILQTFAEAVSLEKTYECQEWPFFSSARKGANVRGYLRLGKGPIHLTCKVSHPDIALLVSEKTGEELDFAGGMTEGVYVVNSPRPPEGVGRSLRLKGTILTVPGDELGKRYLGRPIPNIAVLAALQRGLPVLSEESLLEALTRMGEKRRLPARMIEANRNCLVASYEAIRSVDLDGDPTWEHPIPSPLEYNRYPAAAQCRLRTSLENLTAHYAPPDRRLVFADPETKCTGCSLCIVNCPEGIIRYRPDEKRGILVTGADVDRFCKLCRECIEACPLDLFQEKAVNG